MDSIKRFAHKWTWLLLIIFCIIGMIYPIIGILALICMLAPVVVAFARGRMWCGSFCPRGSFNDTILSRISRNKPIPQILKNTWFRTLFLIVLMGAFAFQLTLAWGDFLEISKVFVRMILITTGITVVLGIIYRHRSWCVICPMGTMASWVTKLVFKGNKIKNVTFKKEKCVNCKLCTKACPIEIDVLSYIEKGKVTHTDCLKCNVCVLKCPKNSLYV